MLSVIHPSSTQQFGAFRSGNNTSNSYHQHHPQSSTPSEVSSSSYAFHPAMVPSSGKWCQQQTWPVVNSASSSYQYPSNTTNSFKFYSSQQNSFSGPASQRQAAPPPKDYSKPLFVDCSIEYELPNAPKIPKNSTPILMIHPSAYKQQKRASSSTVVKAATKPRQGGVKRTHSQQSTLAVSQGKCGLPTNPTPIRNMSSSSSVISCPLSLTAALLQQQQQFCSSGQQATYAAPPAKRCCPGLRVTEEQKIREHQQAQQQQAAQYYWQPTHAYLQQQTSDYSSSSASWVPTPTSSAALAYYKAQLRMRQSFLKSLATPNASAPFCIHCVQGKCSQVAWNKENLGFMRSL